jgi:hypothetical protein
MKVKGKEIWTDLDVEGIRVLQQVIVVVTIRIAIEW